MAGAIANLTCSRPKAANSVGHDHAHGCSGIEVPAAVRNDRTGGVLAFRLVARRHDETFTSERASVYITLANARVWASEGWDVTITDEDGSQFGPAEFEAHIVESHPVLAQAIIAPLAPEHAGEPEPQGEAVDELDQSGQRAGDDRARAGDGPVAVIEAGKPDGSSDATAASERTDA